MTDRHVHQRTDGSKVYDAFSACCKHTIERLSALLINGWLRSEYYALINAEFNFDDFENEQEMAKSFRQLFNLHMYEKHRDSFEPKIN